MPAITVQMSITWRLEMTVDAAGETLGFHPQTQLRQHNHHPERLRRHIYPRTNLTAHDNLPVLGSVGDGDKRRPWLARGGSPQTSAFGLLCRRDTKRPSHMTIYVAASLPPKIALFCEAHPTREPVQRHSHAVHNTSTPPQRHRCDVVPVRFLHTYQPDRVKGGRPDWA